MTPSMPPFLCVLTNARSGTNHLCRLMEALDGVNVNLEPFHPDAPTYASDDTLKAFERAAGRQFKGHMDPELGRWIHDHIEQSLDVLRDSAPPHTRLVVFKLFFDHMPWDRLEDLLVDHHNTLFMIIKRRPIDSYISFCKAKEMTAWTRKDTTTYKPDLDIADFREWHRERSEWYVFVKDMVERRGCAHVTLDYETAIHASDHKTLRGLIEDLNTLGFRTDLRFEIRWKWPIKAVLARLAALIGAPPPWELDLGYRRQDQSTSTADKVNNWGAFIEALEATDDLGLLDRFSDAAEL